MTMQQWLTWAAYGVKACEGCCCPTHAARILDIQPIRSDQNTPPPMINTRDSSRLAQLTTLFAAAANAALDVVAGATAYSSKTGVIHEMEWTAGERLWQSLSGEGRACSSAWSWP
jgi:hypothetical protein